MANSHKCSQTRRDFIKTGSALAAGMAFVPNISCTSKNAVTQLMKRPFGKIGFDVTTFGLGGQASIQWTPPDVDPVKIILKAFDKKVNETDELKKIFNENYVVYHLNYSQENTNGEVLQELGYPQRFGFPVFVILDSDGKRLHTQDSAYLEEGKGHSVKKVQDFLENWTVKAINPDSGRGLKVRSVKRTS